MKNTLRTGFLAVLTCTTFFASAQNESDLTSFLQAAKADANTLITGYTAPIIRGASYGMTNGWYTTAKAHKTLGIDVGVSLTAAFTPASDNYFKPNLTANTTFANVTNPNAGAPTFVGPKDHTTYTSTLNGQSVSFDGPEGLALKKNIGFSAVPVPMIQVGIGIIKNTDLKVRFIPNLKKGDSKVSMFGLGLMHDVKQYLPGADLLPFDLSVLAAFNNVTGTTSLINSTDTNKPTSADGQFKYKLNSWVGQAIISKKLSVLTGYLGVGYGSVSTNADITGSFDVSAGGQVIPLKDPFSTKFKNKSAKLTAGIRLKLGPIYFAGDYTLQKYNALTLGFGASIR